MLLHVLGHVQAHHVLLVVEKVFGEGAREFGLTHAGRSKEYEASDGPVGIFQSGAGAANGVRYRGDGGVLPNDTVVQPLLHVQKLFGLAFQQAVNGDARPDRDEPADVFRMHNVVVFRSPAPGEFVALCVELGLEA